MKSAVGPLSHLQLAEQPFLLFPLTCCPACLVASLIPHSTKGSHHPYSSLPASLLFSIHPASKISRQIPSLSESEVAVSLDLSLSEHTASGVFLYTNHTGLLQWVSRDGEDSPKEKVYYCEIPLGLPQPKSLQYVTRGILLKEGKYRYWFTVLPRSLKFFLLPTLITLLF